MFDENVMPEIQKRKTFQKKVVQFNSLMIFGLIKFRVEISCHVVNFYPTKQSVRPIFQLGKPHNFIATQNFRANHLQSD